MRHCVNCDEKIEDGDACYEMPADMKKGVGMVFLGRERLFCDFCGGNIQYSRLEDGKVKNLCCVSDFVENSPPFWEEDNS